MESVQPLRISDTTEDIVRDCVVVPLQTALFSAASRDAAERVPHRPTVALAEPVPQGLDDYLARRTQAMVEPLQALRSMPDWIEDAMAEHGIDMPADVREMLDQMNCHAHRLQQLARDSAVLEQTAQTAAQPKPVALEPLLRDCARRYNESELWQIDIAARVPAMLADAGLLEKAVCPLIENACIHGALPGGRITVTAEQRGDVLEIRVEDDGEGLPDGDASKASAPFWCGVAAEEGGGSGLGLTMASRCAERLGGSLTLENCPDGGTRACIALPFRPASC